MSNSNFEVITQPKLILKPAHTFVWNKGGWISMSQYSEDIGLNTTYKEAGYKRITEYVCEDGEIYVLLVKEVIDD